MPLKVLVEVTIDHAEKKPACEIVEALQAALTFSSAKDALNDSLYCSLIDTTHVNLEDTLGDGWVIAPEINGMRCVETPPKQAPPEPLPASKSLQWRDDVKELVVVSIVGGLVDGVYSSVPDTRVIRVNWDAADADPADDDIVKIRSDDGHTSLVSVIEAPALLLHEIDDLCIGQAIRAAGCSLDVAAAAETKEVVKQLEQPTRYIVYDAKDDEMATRDIFHSAAGAAAFARSFKNAVVVPFDGRSTANDSIIAKIDGPAFREQRRLLLQFENHARRRDTVWFNREHEELLAGLVNLTDAIADCAADQHGIDCLFASEDADSDGAR